MPDVIPILLITICLPLWIIFHYITKMKTSKGLSPEDEKMLSEVWDSANKMQERIDEMNGWVEEGYIEWTRILGELFEIESGFQIPLGDVALFGDGNHVFAPGATQRPEDPDYH